MTVSGGDSADGALYRQSASFQVKVAPLQAAHLSNAQAQLHLQHQSNFSSRRRFADEQLHPGLFFFGKRLDFGAFGLRQTDTDFHGADEP